MKIAVLSLGTNMGDRQKNIDGAIRALGLLPDTNVLSVSHCHNTKPVGLLNQPDFLNCCVKISTELSPNALLGACLGIEAAMGRLRGEKNGSRVIDVDIVAVENVVMNTPELTLPHPRAQERTFVTRPMSELFAGDGALGIKFR